MGQALAFGLICHWLGSALAYLGNFLAGYSLEKSFDAFFRLLSPEQGGLALEALHFKDSKGAFMGWFLGVGSVIIDPFLTLLHVFVVSTFLYLASRVLITPDPHRPEPSYKALLCIVSFGLGPAVFMGIPFAGGLLGSLYIFAVTIIGIREVFKISGSRALAVAILPHLVFYGVLLAVLATFFIIFVALLSAQ